MRIKVFFLIIVSSIFFCGCKFAIKEYASSIGELTAEINDVK